MKDVDETGCRAGLWTLFTYTDLLEMNMCNMYVEETSCTQTEASS